MVNVMPSWVQCRETGKLIPKEEFYSSSSGGISVLGDIEPFVSPVDGSVIGSRSTLRDHNKRHGVTDPRDYGPNWFSRKKKERDAELMGTTKKAKKERIEAIQKAIYEHGG